MICCFTTYELLIFLGRFCGPDVEPESDTESDDDVFRSEEASTSLLQTADSSINKVLPVARAVPRSVSLPHFLQIIQ